MRTYNKVPLIETPWLLWGAGFALPFCIVIKKGRITPKRLRHEYEHVRQWWQYWIIGFAVLYLWDLARGFISFKKLKIGNDDALFLAYRNVRFERWAREAEKYAD